ncbi:hypothetical protein PTTG_27866 [Puccinia triticina 1-1 BBBD Race 1]|uniref:Uncharacterized protein n=1 Tax=Puccinia triticina (isolate 1-1 / race 1 (BBBD)) TaxID=630390 RepID=A0A180GGG3_PUCT1|nr:hypothetical protein PTTG_27866 [Puccinia triticina 1-1 BBBD Race 1]
MAGKRQRITSPCPPAPSPKRPANPMSTKQAAIHHLIQTLHALRAPQSHPPGREEPRAKRIRIEAAPDGSASLVVAAAQPSGCHPENGLQRPTTIAPASLFSSPSSSASRNPLRSSASSADSIETNQHSPLVSATTQQYGRVIMKKDALISKIGLEAAQRAIRKATRQRRRPTHPLHPPSSSSPPSSPQTAGNWRTGTIAKWLASADDDDDDDDDDESEDDRAPARDLTGPLSELANERPSPPAPSPTVHPSDPQSLFWSPPTPHGGPRTRHVPIDRQQILIDRLGRPDIRWPLHRPSTPPNQQAFFRTDELTIRPGYRPLSQLSFGLQPGCSAPSAGPLDRMLKPGCNLSQAFLLRAPSPTLPPSAGGPDPADENRSPTAAFPSRPSAQRPSPQARPHPPPPFPTNDFSPCSPLRNDLLKLIDHHHHHHHQQQQQVKLENNPTPAHSPSILSQHPHHHQRWLTERDSNSPFYVDNAFPDNPFVLDTPLDNFLGFF